MSKKRIMAVQIRLNGLWFKLTLGQKGPRLTLRRSTADHVTVTNRTCVWKGPRPICDKLAKEMIMASTLARLGTLAIGFGLGGTTAATAESYRGYETPPYTVDRTVGAAEVRNYAPHILAQVTVQGDQDDALGRGFGILAKYIFGGNTGGGQVAMTTPVAQRPAETVAMTTPVSQRARGGDWTVSFSMPSSYTLATLPAPTNDAIRFTEVPAEKQIALRFSGWATNGALASKAAQLQAIADAEGLRIIDGPLFYFYDDPFTLPWNRRNEVAFRIE
jgi:hypothetical protein